MSCRQFCNSGSWSPASGPLHSGLSLESQPEVLPLLPLNEADLLSAIGAQQALRKNLPSVYRGDVQRFWEEEVAFQKSLVDGTFDADRFQATHETLFPRLRPRSRDHGGDEAAEEAGGATNGALDTMVPPSLIRKVYPIERPLYTGPARTAARRRADDYIRGTTNNGDAVADYEVTYDMMKTGGMAVFLAHEEDFQIHRNLAFRVKLSNNELSPPLYLCEMLGVVKESAQTLKWIYYGISSYTKRADLSLAKVKAGKSGTFFKPTGTQASGLTHVALPWEEGARPVLSWEPVVWDHCTEPKTCIPAAQYQQLVTVLSARQAALEEDDGGDLALESDLECDFLAVVDSDNE